jgi:hypothetical protein
MKFPLDLTENLFYNKLVWQGTTFILVPCLFLLLFAILRAQAWGSLITSMPRWKNEHIYKFLVSFLDCFEEQSLQDGI